MRTIVCKETKNLRGQKTYETVPMEIKMGRIFENNEPIKADVGLIFTERKDGILPEYDIRTDRWDFAATASDKVSKEAIARREKRMTLTEDKEAGTPPNSTNATQ